jgi:uncharacterized protein
MAVVRPQKQPQRTCVSCRETQDKRALIRVVRGPAASDAAPEHGPTPEHGTVTAVTIDERGRASGRGAYLCTNPDCWRRALRTGALSRALNVQLSPQDKHLLEGYLEHLEAGAPRSVALAPREGNPA